MKINNDAFKIFTVYEKKDENDVHLDVKFVPEGFVIWLFVPFVNLFWALSRKCWLLFTLILFTYYILFFTGSDNGFFASDIAINGFVVSKLYILMRLLILVFLAVNANEFWRKSLERRGYQAIEIVAATNELEAKRRYFQIVAGELGK